MLPSTCPWEALLALPFLLGTCLPSLWSPLFPSHAFALIPLSPAKVRLSLTLTLSPLVIWYSGQTAHCVALRPLFPFQQAQYVQVFPPKPAPFCKLFAGLGSTNKSATSLLLLFDFRSVFATLSSSPSFLLPQTLWPICQKLPSFSSYSIRLQWVPGHSFLPGNDTADELARRGALLAPSAIPCSLSLVSTLVFSRTGGVLSHLNSSIHRFPRFSRRNLCSLVTLTVSSLICAVTDTACC